MSYIQTEATRASSNAGIKWSTWNFSPFKVSQSVLRLRLMQRVPDFHVLLWRIYWKVGQSLKMDCKVRLLYHYVGRNLPGNQHSTHFKFQWGICCRSCGKIAWNVGPKRLTTSLTRAKKTVTKHRRGLCRKNVINILCTKTDAGQAKVGGWQPEGLKHYNRLVKLNEDAHKRQEEVPGTPAQKTQEYQEKGPWRWQ